MTTTPQFCSFLTQLNPPIVTSFIVPERWATLTDQQLFEEKRFARNQAAALIGETQAKYDRENAWKVRYDRKQARKQQAAAYDSDYANYLETMQAYKWSSFSYIGWLNAYKGYKIPNFNED
jgi:hypothetical protein